MDRFKKAEEYFSRQDVSREEKLEFEPDLLELLKDISKESRMRELKDNEKLRNNNSI